MAGGTRVFPVQVVLNFNGNFGKDTTVTRTGELVRASTSELPRGLCHWSGQLQWRRFQGRPEGPRRFRAGARFGPEAARVVASLQERKMAPTPTWGGGPARSD
jgi:hypothetical protein